MNAAIAIRRRWAFGNPGSESAVAVRDREGPLWGDLPGLRSAPVLMAGDLAAVPPADLLQMLHGGRKSGLLVASADAVQRAILLAGGDIAWASSSEPSERTNELVCRIDLADHTARVAPDRLRGPLRGQIGAVLSGFLEMSAGVFPVRGFTPSAALRECALDTEEMLLRAMQLFDESNNR